MRALPLLLALLTLPLEGCLTTTMQHLDQGRPLAPGKTESTYSLAAGALMQCRGHLVKNEEGYRVCRADTLSDGEILDYERTAIPQLAISWRLGVRDSWGPLRGVDLGWALELPGTLEFDARFGLPGPDPRGPWAHSLSTGWGLGNWADNSLFLQWALSRRLGRAALLYGNLRLTWVATGLSELEFNEEGGSSLFTSHRRGLAQSTLGGRLGPVRLPLLPDYYDLHLDLGAPVLFYMGGEPSSDMARRYPRYSYTLGLGLTWE